MIEVVLFDVSIECSASLGRSANEGDTFGNPLYMIFYTIELVSIVYSAPSCYIISQVANKLYPMPCIAQQIETFANEMLLSVVNNSHNLEGIDVEESTAVAQKVLVMFIAF